MRIRRSKPTGWVRIPNETARDKRLSWRAKGLLLELLSHEDGWETTVEKLVTQAKREGGSAEGRDAMLKAMKELKEAGYVAYRKYRHPHNGQNSRDVFATEIIVCDAPCAPDDSFRPTGFPTPGNPVGRSSSVPEDQATENQGVFKKTNQKTNKKTLPNEDDQEEEGQLLRPAAPPRSGDGEISEALHGDAYWAAIDRQLLGPR